MQCEACGAAVSRWSASPLCPACHAVSGATLPLPDQRQPHSALWLWTSNHARTALATGDLAVIVRAYRTATGASQRQLAEQLGYDPTYISMIETGRREINDVATRLRIARHLGLPPHTLGVTDPDDADYSAMLQFGESTIRLAVIARQAGHGAEAVNELWPLVTRLETRVADGHIERDVLLLLARARAELGVSLGYVLPEERLVSAARWTGRALWLAERLDQQELLIFTLRVHGNELRKIDHLSGAVERLHRAAQLVSDRDAAPFLFSSHEQLESSATQPGLTRSSKARGAPLTATHRRRSPLRTLFMRCNCAGSSIRGDQEKQSSSLTGV
jgi:transcriptional regulator with XRE-family HTH domain